MEARPHEASSGSQRALPETIPAVFGAIAARFSHHSALEEDAAKLTYAELDRLSNRVANGLLAEEAQRPVAMVAPLRAMSVVVMLGAVKAGRVFVPLDTRDPPERIRRIRDQLDAILATEAGVAELMSDDDDDPELALDPGHPALVYFTSGSTGQPKGTIQSHHQLVRPIVAYGITPDDRFAWILPLAFAGSVPPVFGTLLTGATGCLFDPTRASAAMLASWIADGAVTALMTSPSVLRTIALELEDRQRRVESIRLAIVTGERCEWGHLEVARRVLPNAVIMNQYGSTEAGPIAITTIEPHEPLGAGTIPFRNVLPWHTVDIFDESGAPLATGDAGEIVVRGSEVSLGYWKEPGSEEQRFFMGSDGVRFVRTGDRGRRLRDGTLEHLGRVDLRVKVRGQMVDPQAVEHALVGLPQVSEAVVSALPTPDGDTRLVAHVMPEGGEPVVPRELRLALAEQFPPYMIPSVFLAVDTMPRNSRGKVDRAMLRQAALGGASAVRGAHVPARTEKEHELAELVADVLDVESVGVTDDIFELGADSLTAAELLTEIHERLGVDLTTAHLLTAPTIEALAQQLDVSDPGEDGALPLSLAGPGTPFFCLPGGGFAVIELLPLARHLDRPIYSFVSRGFGSRALPHRSVARGAAYFMTAVRTVQPSGPYLIGGFSFGALFAYEMAQQLRAFGETVALLALLDPTWPSSNTLGDRVRQFAIATPDSPRTTSGSARRVLRRLENSMRVRGRRATAGIVARPYARQREVFLDLCLQIGRRYQPKPYDGPSLLVRTTGHTERGDLRDLAHLLTGEKQVVDVPGDHAAILRYPTLGAVAAILEDALNAADVQPAPIGAA